ncbi:unnamed protein product [Rotaria sordida]|uniref:EF-hand domain-containing protein n=1 Tax=Rotaria sordida TaxID=392033 RepID=A0A814IQD3_9BILA|nr:unnamed protein product [Rotaria sordida]CAF3531927.1 unnamed protein product [Rotaria sordida]
MNNNNILTNEQWLEISEAIKLVDETGDRTVLNQLLISIMTNFIETLDNDDDFQKDDDDNMERQFVIALIESELAEMIAIDACSSWCCCRRQKIQPLNQNRHRFSDYLINIARAKSLDKNNNGFIPKENIQRIFETQISNEKMRELLHFVEKNTNGNINYKDFATLMLLIQ